MKYYEGHEVAYRKLFSQDYLSWNQEQTLDGLLNFPYRQELDLILDRHLKNRVGKALDLGCGTGRVSFYLAQKGFQTTGLESCVCKKLTQHLTQTEYSF